MTAHYLPMSDIGHGTGLCCGLSCCLSASSPMVQCSITNTRATNLAHSAAWGSFGGGAASLRSARGLNTRGGRFVPKTDGQLTRIDGWRASELPGQCEKSWVANCWLRPPVALRQAPLASRGGEWDVVEGDHPPLTRGLNEPGRPGEPGNTSLHILQHESLLQLAIAGKIFTHTPRSADRSIETEQDPQEQPR